MTNASANDTSELVPVMKSLRYGGSHTAAGRGYAWNRLFDVDVPVGDARTLTAVLDVLEQLPADLLTQVEAVSARTQDTVTMKLRDGVQVDWGSAAETPLKIAVLATLRSSGAAAGASVIDVSAPRLPITR